MASILLSRHSCLICSPKLPQGDWKGETLVSFYGLGTGAGDGSRLAQVMNQGRHRKGLRSVSRCPRPQGTRPGEGKQRGPTSSPDIKAQHVPAVPGSGNNVRSGPRRSVLGTREGVRLTSRTPWILLLECPQQPWRPPGGDESEGGRASVSFSELGSPQRLLPLVTFAN